MSHWVIARLNRAHDRSRFDCGKPLLNEWIATLAGQFDRRDLSRTFVATRSGENEVLGYYSISSHHIVIDHLPAKESKGLPRLNVPVVLLGRLAVDLSAQGEGLGALLLIDALRRTVHISEHVGIRAVEVDAIDDDAREFYLKHGFRELLDDPNHLLMPIHEIRKMKLDPPA